MSTIAERVAAGAAVLDERLPGWADKIDPTRLDMSEDADCVFGQLYAHPNPKPISRVGQTCTEIGIENTDDHLYSLGVFCAMEVDGLTAGDAEYAALTAEWRFAIGARRAAVA